MALIELKKVSAGYSEEIILKDISLTIEPLDFIGVIGPNGGGKTTLVKLILGLLKPLSGDVVRSGKLNIGYLPQVTNTDKRFPVTAIEVVESGLMSQKKIISRYSHNDRKKAMEVLALMGMTAFSNKNVGELSGGQMQRILLGRAIISSPELLILDEADTFVDNRFEHDLYALLKQLNHKMSILMVSHDVGTITTYVKTIACVNRNLHYHPSNVITQDQLESYNCPIQLITHGQIPHTVLEDHNLHHHHD
ncbi:MAG TPA: ABC transporter ATP-binding protein [Lentimicrobium sp.]|nr:ABC transporter ATP-binding protein [Lentimicrobium sp.]